MSKRTKTHYPGVYYRKARRLGFRGTEKVYYIVFKKAGKTIEEKVGRQYTDNMTPSKAADIRSERIENKCTFQKAARRLVQAKKRIEADVWTVDRLWEQYKAQKNNSKSFRTDKNRYEKYIKSRFGHTEPKALIQLEVDRMNINLLKSLAPQTVKHILGLLKRVVNFGVAKGLCENIPFNIQMPKVDNIKTESLTKNQLTALLEAIDSEKNIQAANLMKMVLYTGMRRGELFNLKWSDVDFQRELIHIRRPKSDTDHKIPMNQFTRELIGQHPRTDSDYVFPGRKGKKRVDIHHQVNRIKNNAGLPKDFRPLHGLRHVYASMLASTGQVDLYTLQMLLTHKHPTMTQRYAHLCDDALRRASILADQMIAQQTGLGSNRNSKKYFDQS